MNVKHIRVGARAAAGSAVFLGAVGILYKLLDDAPITHDDLWGAAIVTILVVGFAVVVETIIACTAEAVESQPKARHLVAATMREMEEEAAREAGLPHIVGGERLR